jgi:hypothetical protein
MSTKSREDIVNFFECLKARRFSEAEKTLETLKETRFTRGNSDFNNGYINALEGFITSYRTEDDREFLQKVPFDKNTMKKYSKEFKDFVKNGFRSPFDVGYFLAWSDLIQYRMETED